MSPLLRETEGPTKCQAARKLTKSSHDKWYEKVDYFSSPFPRGERRESLFEDEDFPLAHE
jgi:hypothetical protein